MAQDRAQRGPVARHVPAVEGGRLLAEELDRARPSASSSMPWRSRSRWARSARASSSPISTFTSTCGHSRSLASSRRSRRRRVERCRPCRSRRSSEGEFGHAGFGPLLLKFTEQKQTGVLCVTREAEENRSICSRGRSCLRRPIAPTTPSRPSCFAAESSVFATRRRSSAAAEQKRAGTILREMGILSQEELVRFVREQLQEIVVGIFGWREENGDSSAGSYRPSRSITLDVPNTDLVFKGVRAVPDFTAIREGCGPLGAILQPVDDVLSDSQPRTWGQTSRKSSPHSRAAERSVGSVNRPRYRTTERGRSSGRFRCSCGAPRRRQRDADCVRPRRRTAIAVETRPESPPELTVEGQDGVAEAALETRVATPRLSPRRMPVTAGVQVPGPRSRRPGPEVLRASKSRTHRPTACDGKATPSPRTALSRARTSFKLQERSACREAETTWSRQPRPSDDPFRNVHSACLRRRAV